MLHGADHFAAGTRSMITGRAIPTASEMLLQKMGMTPQWAAFTNNLLSTGGVFGGINRLCYLTYQASRLLAQRAMNSYQVTEQILFGQKNVSAFFSDIGTFNSKSIAEVAQNLRNGTISPKSLPIEIVVRNGKKITLNNRSLLALKRAGLEPEIIIDRTGILKYENWLDRHLKGNLPSDVIRIRGGSTDTSLITPTN